MALFADIKTESVYWTSKSASSRLYYLFGYKYKGEGDNTIHKMIW